MLDYLVFGNPSSPKPIALLVAAKDLQKDLLQTHYVDPLVQQGISIDDIIAINVEHDIRNKISLGDAREYLKQVKPILDSVNTTTILCCDGVYFKALTRKTKVEAYISYNIDTLWPEQTVFYCPSFRQIFFNPAISQKIDLALRGLVAYFLGQPQLFAGTVLEDPRFAISPKEQLQGFKDLLQYPVLTCDIETFDLHVAEAGLGTIAFAWDKHSGIAFGVDYRSQIYNWSGLTRTFLKNFLEEYVKQGGRLIYHGSTFDIKVLIWELWMISPEDITGMLKGLDIMFTLMDDTKTLAYLALNSAGGNSLSLKELAFEFVGNYAIDIKNIRDYTVQEVLEYNLLDACATWYVYDKYRNIVRQEQEQVYQEVFRPALKTITQMELVGMPLNLGQVLNAETELEVIRQGALTGIHNSPIIQAFTNFLRELEAEKANAKLKKLRKTADDFLNFEFNPNSNPQVQLLLYQELEMPVINKTVKGNPSTDSKTLKALLEREKKAKQPRTTIIDLIMDLLAFAEVDILLNTFIPAFKNKSVDKAGWRYLLGNFNLGGAVSGRLSSSDPNLHNIPNTGGVDASKTKKHLAKSIKKCFQAPPYIKINDDPYGWLFVGADYFSLEDKISALLTKDPNKLAVYTDGYDGHCLRAYSYFSSKMPDIAKQIETTLRGPEKVEIINSIADLYPDIRQDSKGPTFALTYMGTWKTLVKSFGISVKEAKQIEAQYHKLYFVSDEWVKEEIRKAGICGYVELAFGLRLRTPMLPKVVLTSYDTLPYEAYQEVKTAANALGQSYGLLNTYSANKFMEEVWVHPKYREWVLPGAQIHDSQYYRIKNHLGCVKWVNDHLIKWMEWCDLDPIRHDTVGLGAELEVFHPDWSNPIVLPNYASLKQIKETLNA